MLDYEHSLNPAQYEAAAAQDDSVLVVAGAGSGKTRTIIYRLAWLVEHGISPESILLLTFTRKAAREMLNRAANLLGCDMGGISGGTFHSFAYGALRRYSPEWLGDRSFTLLDGSDITQAIGQCRDNLNLGKSGSSFPKNQTIADILSKARNKELAIEEIIRRDSFHLLPHAGAISEIGAAYASFKKANGLFDYDDLLFELEEILKSGGYAASAIRGNISHILVDEYQDTNLVQARLVQLLAGSMDPGHERRCAVMAVGDEAQSIYSFRGANVRNILDFPALFPDTRVIRLEENYRSTQPILDLANDILSHAAESYRKKLYTEKQGGEEVKIITPLSDRSQAELAARRIQELLEKYKPGEIAVLFRSGFHSFPLENELRKEGIAFCKYGGVRFIEAAHIKDILAFARLAINRHDYPAFSRVAAMHKGIGPKTSARLHTAIVNGDEEVLKKARLKHRGLFEDMLFIDRLVAQELPASEFFGELLAFFRPRLETLYPEDWPMRLAGLEEVAQMAQGYESADLFIADLALDAPQENRESMEDCVVLSTIHSAKGLEWKAVLVIDVVEERFPSRHALVRPEDFEEERRLFYVAGTRAQEVLEIYSPATVYSRSAQGAVPMAQSPFLRELSPESARHYTETWGLGLQRREAPQAASGLIKPLKPVLPEKSAATGECNLRLGYCRHRIFGRGKIIKKIDDEKVQVNFPGFGLKVILAEYLIMEE